MSRFFVLTLNGLTQGAIYAAMALALVMIWRATKVINFAQGAMAMFTTYLALFAIDHGAPYWVGFLVALLSGFLLGAIVERVIVRPVESAPPLNVVILTLGLLLFLEALAPMAFGGQIRSFPPAFSIVGLNFGNSQVAFHPEVAGLLGIRVGRMLTLGWALASLVGALAGVLIAPSFLLYPTFMDD